MKKSCTFSSLILLSTHWFYFFITDFKYSYYRQFLANLALLRQKWGCRCNRHIEEWWWCYLFLGILCQHLEICKGKISCKTSFPAMLSCCHIQLGINMQCWCMPFGLVLLLWFLLVQSCNDKVQWCISWFLSTPWNIKLGFGIASWLGVFIVQSSVMHNLSRQALQMNWEINIKLIVK